MSNTPQELRPLAIWNDTQHEYPKDKTIHQLFEEQVEKTRDKIAIVYEGQQVTYSALNERANQLAHYLRHLGVEAESRVGIALPRGVELILGLFAALKAGGVYIPLDISYPSERLEYMLEDSQAKLLLTIRGVKIPENYSGKVVYVDEEILYLNQPTHNLCISLHPENLAYITYTSGSTGRPKGVACDHKGVVNRLSWGWNNYCFKENETCCLQSSIAFVDSTWDIFGTLLVGAKLILYKEDMSKDIEMLLKICFFQKITRITLIPSFLNTLLHYSSEKLNIHKKYLTHWEITGESFQPNLIENFFKQMGQTLTLLDCYGATEATSVIYRDFSAKGNFEYQTKILSNTHVYLLDAHLNRVPIGVEGEIYIGGVGLARGYLNKPGLTAERFIPNPFEEGRRLYKTGDLGRYLPDGNIEFLGRIDDQIKIRGFRIELGEIEGTLGASLAVQQAIVLCREDVPGQKRLVAYVVPKNKEDRDVIGSLQNFCQSRLPEYMHPSQWVVLDAFPLTPNGKIDRKGLPAPEGREGLGAYQAPKGLIEERLAKIWSELLGIEVGREDNFFRIGGHSLLATQMVSRLRETLKLEVPLKVIFEHSVLSELARYLEQSHLETEILPPITRVTRDTPQSLSFAQQRLWFIEQLLPDTTLYHNPMCFRLLGNLNRKALRQALDTLVARHEILRTVVINQEGVALQKVLPEDTGFTLRESTEDTDAFLKKTFQFESEPLCKGLLLRRSEQEHLFILVFHHMVVDDWSMEIFWKELNAFYKAYSENKPLSLPPLPVQYVDYSVWQRNWLQGEILEKQLSYWQDQLREVSRLELPTDYPRPKELTYEGGVVHRKLSKELLNRLQAFSQSQGVTLFMSLVASIQGFLSRYCNQHDIAIGTPISNRRASETEGMLGFFVNTLVIRNQLGDNPSFETLIKDVESTTLSAYEHQDVPFEQLVEYLQVSRELNRNPLFQVMFNLQYEGKKFQLQGLEIHPEESTHYLSRFDLLINATTGPDGLSLKIDYAKELFHHERIEKLAEYYETFLRGLLQEPSKRISEISLLSEEEHQQLTFWNKTTHAYPNDKCIYHLFEEQVERAPNNIAVIYEDEELTYQDLNARANKLAHYLRSLGVEAESKVGLLLPRGADLVVGILAILKAGGAYVPFDLESPQERLAYMLKNSQVKLLLNSKEMERPEGYSGNIVCLDDESLYSTQPTHNLCISLHPENLAYIIYTSGSTGRPKGVGVSHGSAGAYLNWAKHTYSVNDNKPILFHGSICFDMSITSLFVPLLTGKPIKIIKDDFSKMLEDGNIKEAFGFIKLTPSHLKLINESPHYDLKDLSDCFIVGGEAFTGEHLTDRNLTLWNEYGPTEATVACSLYEVDKTKEYQTIPIGRPIWNTQMYILDKYLNPVPLGVEGEIYIGGVGLARGYVNKPGMTAERFIPNPFEEGSRLYKTGDLGRYLPDGNIAFLGRIDDQIKMRGFRIELGEIESALMAHGDVNQAVVLFHPDKERLVAYVTPNEFTPEPPELFAFLGKKLPDYMIPSRIIVLDMIPLTANGKIDRKCLPSPEGREGLGTYQAPEGVIEERLAKIWSELLRVEKLSRTDNFFQIGGDSIVSIQLVSRARKQGMVFTVKQVFETPTLAGLALQVKEEKINLGSSELLHGKVLLNTFKEGYPLSPLQKGLLFQALYEKSSDAYFVQMILELTGELRHDVLKQAWVHVIERHESLRASFVWEGLEAPIQIIEKEVDLPWHEEDWQGLSEVEQAQRLEAYIAKERAQGFDFTKAPLMRWSLFKYDTHKHYLLWSQHHILSDGWSNAILLSEVKSIYDSMVNSTNINLPLRRPYGEYISWLSQQDQKKAEEFWKTYLSTIEGPTQLSFKGMIEKNKETDYETYCVEFSPEETEIFKQFAKEHTLTLNTLFQGAVGLVLKHYTQQSEVIMGITVSGRTIDLPGVEEMVGLFINALPLKISPRLQSDVLTFLENLQQQTQKINEFASTSLSDIQSWTNGAQRLFDVLFVFENYPVEEEVNKEETTFSITGVRGVEKTEYPLTIIVEPRKHLRLELSYQTEHFDKETMKRFASHIKTILHGILHQQKNSVEALPMLTPQEQQQIMVEWNDTQATYPADKTVHQLFEEQVEKTPDNIAVVYENQELTYRQLNERANQLAHYLRNKGVGPDALVAIAVERSLEMIIGLLGILKAGGAYVPLDPSYPFEQLSYILKDVKSSLLLTQSHLKEKFLMTEVELFFLDEHQETLSAYATSDLPCITKPAHLSYVIYTSGSTGKPKGVLSIHKGSVNRLLWMKDYYNLQENDCILQKTPYTFDVSVWELLLSLLSGARVVFASPEGHKDPFYLNEMIKEKNVTLTHFVPSMLEGFLASHDSFECPSLKRIIASGEALSFSLRNRFFEAFPHVELHNLYGPTEASIDVTSWNCSSKDYPGIVPIGKPINNTAMYILDKYMSPIPVGVTGELYIGGIGLARGYLNKPSLTAERFIPHPFEKGSRLYKTGDLARYLPDGNIEFLGRNDHQVKLRGFRVELGEIERTLEASKVVQQAIVLCREDVPGQKRLVAYVIPKNKEDKGVVESLQTLCQSCLPDHMHPSQWVVLESFPVTVNGKVDRKSLPIPEGREGLGNYQAPEGVVEEQLAKIWSELLGIEKIGRMDNFFQVGGDSIISIQLVSRARQQGILFTVKQVFETPTLAGLAIHAKEEQTNLISQELVQGEVPLSPIQTWFFEENPIVPHHYNQVMWIKSEDPIDLDKLQNALKAVYHHHDGFRLRYRKGLEGWEQYYTEEESPFPWKVWQSSAQENLRDICTELQASLNIEEGPLSQLMWFTESRQLLWVIHHLAVDGVSWRILLEDLNLAYAGKALGPKSHSYLDWSQSLSRYVTTGEIKYYQTQLKVIPRLTTDYAYIGYIALKDVQGLDITFSEQTTKNFLQKAHQAYGTQPDDLLLLALTLAVGDCLGQYEVCVDLEGHGREDLGENLDLTRTLGWFTSMHPVVLMLPEPSDLDQSIKHIKEHLRQIPQKGVSYGILSKIQKSCAFVQGDILFNYLGQWSNTKRNDETFFFGEGETGLSASLDNPHSHPLAINGGVNQGQLRFHWSYSTYHYKRATIEKLSMAFKKRLEELIEYCSEEKNYGFSPSDFPYVKLAGSQLDNLLKKLKA